ncbi:MAG: branched-chain amino acid ABC transporter permease [Chloroflexi bacterium]|nr:branched-chain amino acid ABC transporter permease [Chloroflexota bacterium]
MDDVIVQGICVGGVYALIALGFSVVFKSTTVINLAYGGQILILAYALYWLLDSVNIPLGLAVFLLFLFGAALALLLEQSIIRPLYGRPLISILIATLMLWLLMKGLSIMVWGGQSYGYPFTPTRLIHLGPVSISPAHLYCLIAAAAVFILLLFFFNYTKIGLALRVVGWNRTVAQSLGIRVKRFVSISWVLAGIFSALIAILVGMTNMVTPEMDFVVLGKGFPVLLLGGLWSTPGCLLGGLIIGVAEALSYYYASDWGPVVPWMIMLAILLIRPWGLLGEKLPLRI